jgi:hypothetical protein
MSYPTGQTTGGGGAPYLTGAQHEAVSPQVTGVPSPQPGPVSPQITGVTDSQANGATHGVQPAHTQITASEPPRETVESMGSGMEVVPDQPPTYGGKCQFLGARPVLANGEFEARRNLDARQYYIPTWMGDESGFKEALESNL